MRTVHELTENELEELRNTYFCLLLDSGDDELLNGINWESDIPMSNVKAHYEGTYFVEDDFLCNQN